MKIIADPNIPFVREAFAALGEIELIPGRKMNAAAVRDAELLLVRSVTPVNAALLDGSKVRFVATATIGTDHVDAGYLASRQIGFASAAGSNANSVAEYIVAAMLELAHRRKFRLRSASSALATSAAAWFATRRRLGCACCRTIRRGSAPRSHRSSFAWIACWPNRTSSRCTCL
jgi:erythronate-4-phosphate dehydrogenase